MILILLLLVRSVFRKIVEGDFKVNLEWLTRLARWFSMETGWHQTRWGMIAITLGGGLIVGLILKLLGI